MLAELKATKEKFDIEREKLNSGVSPDITHTFFEFEDQLKRMIYIYETIERLNKNKNKK